VRTIGVSLREALMAQETGEAILSLMTIDHEDINPPIRVVQNDTDIVSRGNTFVAYPFDIGVPGDDPDRSTELSLTIDNVDVTILQGLRAIVTPPVITLELVAASAPDTVELGPMEFKLYGAKYDAMTITGQLRTHDILNEAFPGNTFTPGNHPGKFSR
jgi:hypothetical protein